LGGVVILEDEPTPRPLQKSPSDDGNPCIPWQRGTVWFFVSSLATIARMVGIDWISIETNATRVAQSVELLLIGIVTAGA
jgi:hypothetical protein